MHSYDPFFPQNGTFINKPLSRDSREETYEINAVDPVEKDQIEAKLWTFDHVSLKSKTAWDVFFLSPFCIQMMHFFIQWETFLNKPLSRDGREAINETNALYPVEKDQIKAKLWTLYVVSWCLKLHKTLFSKSVLHPNDAFFS